MHLPSPFARFLAVLACLPLLSAQTPLQVSMPITTARLQITGLPANCEVATLQLQNSDKFLPGSQTLSRAVALLKGQGAAPDYGVEFLLGPGMAPQIYGPQQVSLSCASADLAAQPTSPLTSQGRWHNSRSLQINQAEISLTLTPDFVPTVSASIVSAHDLRQHASLCRQAASPRFFADQGDNYTLSFNGGTPVTIIGRKTWGAGPPILPGRSWQPYPAEASVCSWFRRITVHHTHTALSIQALQKFHQTQADPKADIAYHFYIPASGEIYEARPLGYLGSHSEGDNSANLGIVLNGDFSEKAPSPAQITALRQLLTALRCPCGFSDGVWTHQQRKHLKFKGDPAHSTECPGKELASEVYGLAKELGFGPITTLP